MSAWNDANYNQGWGQYLPHQNLNISGFVNLPWGVQLSLNSSIISSTPGTVVVSSLDLPGTVPSGQTEPLPGLPYGCVNVSCSTTQIVAAVNAYNATIAGTPSAKGPTSLNPAVKLPPNFSTGNPVISQDLRVTKTITYRERYSLAISADIFNVLNISEPCVAVAAAGRRQRHELLVRPVHDPRRPESRPGRTARLPVRSAIQFLTGFEKLSLTRAGRKVCPSFLRRELQPRLSEIDLVFVAQSDAAAGVGGDLDPLPFPEQTGAE